MQVGKRDLEDVKEEENQFGKKQNTVTTNRREFTTIIVRNLPKSYNNNKVRKYFQACGIIKQVDVVLAKDGKSKLGRVEFNSYDGVLSALTKTFKLIGSHEITVEHLENMTLWITNFPPYYNVTDLRNLLNSFEGCCLNVRLPSLRFNSDRRFAYADMDSQEHATEIAEELNGKVIEGFKIVIKKSNPLEKDFRTDAGTRERREIYISQLDSERVTADKLRALFTQFGTIESINIPSANHNEFANHKKGFAFIMYETDKAASAAVSLNNTEFEGTNIIVSIADRKAYLERKRVKQLLNSKSSKDNVISLFPFSDKVSKSQIQRIIKDHASFLQNEMIKDIFLVTDHEGALILLNDEKIAAKLILALNGCKYASRTLKCGTIKELSRHYPSINDSTRKTRPIIQTQPRPSIETSNDKKMNNEDFRKLLLQND
ncbi:U6 snRNP complex subunit PRP24 Ecym_2700 [Eremothecium cymbalariae DBVPG|uniref:RRM domain-containing protein n=1 Tax=Eremothecium cymbalariae (strain CBS 270.75 / DBVPG 7215 / KCTC 17166 / NRRL Y-17582) TaxID=931890 RepID=G8JPE0_ERECY|nr:Hypothetical protein Ecym_2700 [Eremothecium cymbalariae DBVPG\